MGRGYSPEVPLDRAWPLSINDRNVDVDYNKELWTLCIVMFACCDSNLMFCVLM